MKKKEKKKYVLGFAFDRNANHVLLMIKKKPEWQVGRFNGIGGKIEPGEDPLAAMVREFHEEVGNEIDPAEIWLPAKEWERFAWMGNDEWECYCFRAFNNNVWGAKKNESEEVHLMTVSDPNYGGACSLTEEEALSNIPWLVLLARDRRVKGTIIQYNKGE